MCHKTTPWPVVRKRTIPTERPPLFSEIWCQLLRIEGWRVVSAADPDRLLISVFLTGAATCISSSSSFILTRAEWTPYQTHCYAENLTALEIEPGTSGPRSLELWPLQHKGCLLMCHTILKQLKSVGTSPSKCNLCVSKLLCYALFIWTLSSVLWLLFNNYESYETVITNKLYIML
jgi:hypothetical protein